VIAINVIGFLDALKFDDDCKFRLHLPVYIDYIYTCVYIMRILVCELLFQTVH
jgi:hypothetical protein